MRGEAIFIALLALSFGAQAVPVSREQAAVAVRKWARSGRHLEVRHGTEVEKSATLTTDGGRTFHAIKLKGRGTVFTSSDTESEPIVAFTSSTEDFSSMDRQSPLWALLSRDAEVRANIRAYRAAEAAKARKIRVQAQSNPALTGTTVSPVAQTAGTAPSPAARRWARLLSEEKPSDPAVTSATAPRKEDESEIDDIRRSPLLTTTWSQTTHNDDAAEGLVYYRQVVDPDTSEVSYDGPYEGTGKPCYNYYTPEVWNWYYADEHGNADVYLANTPCGCTATATAQLMKCFRFPSAPAEPGVFECTVNGASTFLETLGGSYDWDRMADHPASGATDEQSEAIGHLTYDVSVALGSSYSAGETSAYPYYIADALTGYFGYSNAVCLWAGSLLNEALDGESKGRITSSTGLHDPTIRRNVVYTNLDRKQPVVFGIYGFSSGHVGDLAYWAGHAVVGDGYGFLNFRDEETGEATNTVEYVHINMGWSGTDDAWYNIPEIDAVETGASGDDEGFNFTVMAAAVYNVFTNETGEIISGRVLKENGEPVAGALVESEDLSAVTDEKGIWSMVVPSASNRVVVAFGERDNLEGSAKVTVKTSAYPQRVGNAWGADIVLSPSSYAESVRRNGVLYGSVDAAYAEASSGDTLEVLATTRIRGKTFAFAKNLTLKAVDAPDERPVVLRMGGEVSVTDGARLNLVDLAFRGAEYQILSNLYTHVVIVRGEERTITEIPSILDLRNFTNITAYAEMNPISIAAGSKLSVAGELTMPVLEFADDEGFVLAGEILDDIRVIVPSFARGARVGSAECGAESAIASSEHIVNAEDRFLTAMPSPYPTLVWDLAQVDDADLVATLEIDGDTQTYRYSNLDRLLKDAGTGDATITVKKNCTLTKPLEVCGRKLAIRGGTLGLAVRDLGQDAGFVIGDGGFLTVSNLTFRGHTGAALFTVDGEGAQLTLADAVRLVELNGTGAQSGAVTVMKGTATLLANCQVYNCAANGSGQTSGKGGAVYLNGAGCTLNLFGGSITYCRALSANGGGGVYAARDSVVNLKGPVIVRNNTSGSGSRIATDDILMNATKSRRPLLTVQDELTGAAKSIGVRYDNEYNPDYGNEDGKKFADVDCGLAEAESSAPAFFSDLDPAGLMLKPAFVNDEDAMVWEEVPNKGPRTEPSPTDVARIVRSATVTNYFDGVEDAFASIDEDGLTVEMLRTGLFFEDIVLNHVVTVCRAADAPADDIAISRVSVCGFVIPAGASLTVSNLTVKGRAGAFGFGNRRRLFDVCGGELTLGPGAVVCDVDGTENRAAGAVVVSDGGVFTMTNAVIRDCCNDYVNVGNATGVGAGLLVDRGTARLYGGTITGCRANRSAGVCIGNGGVLFVKGAMAVTNNLDLADAPSDLTVEDLSAFVLEGDFTGPVGVIEGIYCDTNVFGTVDAAYYAAADVVALTNGAASFHHDRRGVRGMVATNGTENALLVWSDAFVVDEQGNLVFTYVDANGEKHRYGALTGGAPTPGPVIVHPDPIAFKSITRVSDTEWILEVTNIVPYCNYRLLWTTDLTKGFTHTGEWAQAAADAPKAWTNDVITSDPVAWFWRAEGKEGEKPAE